MDGCEIRHQLVDGKHPPPVPAACRREDSGDYDEVHPVVMASNFFHLGRWIYFLVDGYHPWRIHGAGRKMLAWLGYIDGIHVTIYSSTMDPIHQIKWVADPRRARIGYRRGTECFQTSTCNRNIFDLNQGKWWYHGISGWWFGTMEFYDFPYIGNVIIPTDELIFFRGVGIPPTRYKCWYHWYLALAI